MSDRWPRSDLELLRDQVRAVTAFAVELTAALAEQDGVSGSRELKVDASRRAAVLRRQHAAMVVRTDEHLLATGQPLPAYATYRAVIAHRSDWFAGKVAGALVEAGWQVLDPVDNGPTRSV